MFDFAVSGKVIHNLYQSKVAGDVWVFLPGCDFPYKFRGVQDEGELMRAVMYIMYKDNITGGVYTNAARYGYAVYGHGQSNRISHWWDLPNKVKFRGYRFDL